MMQTILGAGGAIGIELARALPKYTSDIRLVSRNPKKINNSDQLVTADLCNRDQVLAAVKGSHITYLTLGFDYKTTLWQERWPVLIKNVVDACIEHKSKLVFFDNVYAIGGDNIKHITENSPISPNSKKGEVRAFVDQHILDAISNRKLEAIIARAPDFFGPVKDKSLLMNLIYDNLAKGKAAQWFCNADVVHSSGFTPDLAKGTALLGNTESAYNNIWNLPVDNEHITGKQWIKLFAYEMQKPDKVQVLPGWGMRALGLFVPVLKEMYEMRYQYNRAYYFDSSKFNKAFKYVPTPNSDAVKKTVQSLK